VGEGQDRVQVAASPEAVWKVIADIEGHARLAGSSEILAIRFQGPLRVGAGWEADERITGVGRFTADHYHDIAAHLGWWRLGNALTGAGALLALAGLVGVCRALGPRQRRLARVLVGAMSVLTAAYLVEVALRLTYTVATSRDVATGARRLMSRTDQLPAVQRFACWGEIVSWAWVPITVLVPHALLPFSMDEVGQLTAVRVPGRRGGRRAGVTVPDAVGPPGRPVPSS
jgi:hypothetical protein